MINILCIIPARSGSKSLPGKNIKKLNGKPLFVWSIEQAKLSKYKSQIKIFVSTDSKKYAEIAKENGVEVPFLRPKEISQDLSTDYQFLKHCLYFLKIIDSYVPDIILLLRPTQPCRKIKDIDKCLDLFIQNRDKYDSLRTVVPFEKSPYKMYTINNDNNLIPLFKEVNGISEPYNQPRQILPQCYLHNGYIDIFNTKIINNGTISGEKIYPYIMSKNDTIDIDSNEDWIKAENSFS
uniref:Cytidylyltransferase n=1 Tax=viral metagenome TaxID=1070528 RepID=A0A6C0AY19_9ZZZZ|tara:strand:+ start:22 stop:732 length:711 start_codon:yes stop_codon:yes gene_type:complete